MRVKTAEFAGAVASPGQAAPESLPEIAVAGRSNVGKSSLINALLGRKRLARTSKQPGRTQEINFFRINDRFLLVDLPGYGYARAPVTVRNAWGRLVESYLTGSENLVGVISLFDSRRGVTVEDEEMLDLLNRSEVPALFALTKIDKLNRAQQHAALRRLREDLDAPDDQLLLTSAKSREGLDDLLASIGAMLEPDATSPSRAG